MSGGAICVPESPRVSQRRRSSISIWCLVLAGIGPACAASVGAPPSGADVEVVVGDGSDVPRLEDLAVPGKVTLVDLGAEWCGPCKDVERHVNALLGRGHRFAVRRLDVRDWDSPLARHYLAREPALPWVVVFDRQGRRVGAISGADLAGIDALIARAER